MGSVGDVRSVGVPRLERLALRGQKRTFLREDARLGHPSGEGISLLRRHLKPGGVFAMWSDAPPEEGFLGTLGAAIGGGGAEVVTFPNPLTGERSSCTVYLAGPIPPPIPPGGTSEPQ